MKTPPNSRLIPVGLGTRFWAIQIDLLAFWIIIIFLRLVFTGSIHPIEREPVELIFLSLPLYFWLSNRFGSASLGQRIMGYKIIAVEGLNPQFGLRILYGAFACFLGILTLAAYHHIEDGIYWWDRKSNTRAVPLAYAHPN